ncbi:MAG: F0F1 ATP synthase subunit delta, partial [Myxococcaceae bacterium]
MVNVSVARRYARALFELAGASSDKVLEQLQSLQGALSASSELSDLLTNPSYTQAQRLS